jgi:hypothetical protein
MTTPSSDTLFEILDAAGADGYASFSFSKQYADYVFQDLPKNKGEALRCILESLFRRQPLLTLKLDRLKRWVTDIETTAVTDAEGTLHVRMNLARMFLLPCEKPAEELAELRGFFTAMLPFFEAHAKERSHIQICNNRDRKKAVYASFNCSFEGAENGMSKDDEVQARLQAMVDASPVLQAFFRNVALALQKIGPWSWVCIDEDSLYGPNQGPWSQSFFEQHQAKNKTA